MKQTLITVVVSVFVVVVMSLFLKPEGGTTIVRQAGVGAVPGPEVYDRMYFRSGSTDGGRVATTSTASTYTTVARDFNGTPTYIDWLPNVNTTVSLSSTSTFEYVPNVGDVAKVYLRNASSTAAATITLAAADGGLDLQDNEDSANLAIAGLDWAELTFIRESVNLVTVLVNETTEAD